MNLLPALRRKQMTQTALANAIGVEKGFVSELISGKKNPSFPTYMKIVEVLDLDPGEAFTGRHAPSDVNRTVAEERLLSAFRSLPPERQKGWLDMAVAVVGAQAPATDKTD